MDSFWALGSSLCKASGPPFSPQVPQTVEEGSVRGEGVLLSLTQTAPCPQVPHSGQRHSQHLPALPTPPIPPHPQASKTGQERIQGNPVEVARGPIQLSDPRSGGQAIHVDAVNITVQKTQQAQYNKAQASKLGERRAHQQPGAALVPGGAPSPGVSLQTPSAAFPGRGAAEASYYICGFKLRCPLHFFFFTQLIFKSLATVTVFSTRES